MYDLERNDQEIDQQLNRAMNVADRKGTLFRGLTYEQGVADALRWVTGDSDDKPLTDDDYAEFDE